MSFFCPAKYETNYPNRNEEFAKLKGELSDREAQISLIQFLRYNIGFTTNLISGVNPAFYQEILLKACMNRNFSMIVGARGCAKSTLAAWLSFLIPIFEPNTNIIICAPTFRGSRHIFSNLEKITKSPEAKLLRQCFTSDPSKRNDEFNWILNGGIIRSVPLSNDKLRGFRASVLILDEFLMLSENTVKTILQPFLVAPKNIKERIEITERENDLIKQGLMNESQRTVFESNTKMIALTSASYTFEYAYQVYSEWANKIYQNEPVKNAKYFVCNISYEALPEYMVEKSIIEEAKKSEDLHPAFKREYMAQFVDGSDSYFSAKKMHQLTIPDGQNPTVLLRGNPDKKYILSIDPNHSQSTGADHFAMCVLELNEEDETAVIVHNYAVAGVELKEHIKYFYYLLNAFNINMICVDNADGQFIQSANESSLFVENKLKINLIDYDGSENPDKWLEMLQNCKNQYNLENKKICFKHIFNQESIRRINEQLQTWINNNRIYFGSKLTQSDSYDSILSSSIPYPFSEKENKDQFVINLISTQDDMIPLLKKECALIEVRSNPSGGQVFDLPNSLKRNTGANRARKDSYTALMLGVEGAQAFFNIMKQKPKPKQATLWLPQMLGNSTYR